MKKVTFLVIVMGLLLALFVPSAHAVLIDDYSVNQGPLTIYTSDTVTDSGILGGQRRVYFWGGGPPVLEVSGGTLDFTNIANTNAVAAYVMYEGPGGSGLGPVDLTEGGASDRFLIDVSAVTLGEVLGDVRDTAAAFKIFINDGSGNGLISENFVFIDTPRVYEVLFSDMITMGTGGDLAAAQEVVIYIDTLYYFSSITIDNFSTGGTGAPDADADGVPDGSDLCPDTVAGPVDAVGCSDAQVDIDGDGYCDVNAPGAGPSACIGTDNCPTISNFDQADTNNGGFGDACVDPSVDIPDNAFVDPTATVGAGSEIDRGASIGPGVDVGENVDIDKNAAIGENSSVGDGASIDQGATVGANVSIGPMAIIKRNAVIDDGANIGDRTVVDRGAFVGADATVEADVLVGRIAVVCPTARVLANVTLGRNAFVDTGVIQTVDIPGSGLTRSPSECAALP